MHLKSLIAAMALSTALVAAPAMAQDQGALITPIDRELSVVFIPKVIHPWYDVVQAGAAAAVAELAKEGITVNVSFDSPPQADVADHNRRIETNIGRRPDALAVSCLDASTNVQILKEAVNQNINVLTFDTYCSDDFPFIGHQGNYEDGADLAHFLAERIGGSGKVGILAGSLTAANHAERVKGFKETIATYPNIQIAFEQPDDDSLEKAVSLTESALQANPDLAGIFGANASAPVGAATAVVNAGLTGKVTVVGMDDLPETIDFIRDGTIAGSKAQRQWEIGYWVVRYAVAKNQNHTIPMNHATGSQILTKESLQ